MARRTRLRLAWMMAVMPTLMIVGFVAVGLILLGRTERIDGLAWRGAAGAVLLYLFFVWAIARGLRKRFA